jgi:uncharacterized protein YcbK (DUF882 family)
LRLYHTHTNEHIDVIYRRGGQYLADAIDRLNRFLRDHRTGEVHPYDPRVFDLLNDLAASLGRSRSEINIICGYRTRWSNELLRQRSSGVARHSLHVQAEAIDIRIPGVATARLRDASLRSCTSTLDKSAVGRAAPRFTFWDRADPASTNEHGGKKPNDTGARWTLSKVPAYG